MVDKHLRLIYTGEVSGDEDGSGVVRCLRSCVNQMKEMEAETDAWRKQNGRFPFSFGLIHVLRRLRPV